jgi:outer membrane protein assembly factor BamA
MSKPETVFDPARLQADAKRLHRMGYFERIEAESKPDGQGHVDVLFRVCEYPFVSGFLIEGADDKLQSQIQDYLRQRKLELRPATPYHPSRGNEVAIAVREYLRARKYPNAEVGISARGEGNSVRVVLSIRSGAKVEVGRVSSSAATIRSTSTNS